MLFSGSPASGLCTKPKSVIKSQITSVYCLLFLQGICCLFLAQNSPLLFSKKQATDTLIKNQNPRNPNKRVGLRGE